MIDVDPEFLAFLQNEAQRADDSDLDDERATAIDFYNGALFGDEVEGRSKLVTRDVAEVVDHMGVSVLRTVVSGDDVVEFAHGDQDKAQEATEAVQHLFMEEQNGYLVLHDALKAGNLEKTGPVKTYYEKRPPKRVKVRLNIEQAMGLEAQGLEFAEADEPGEDGTFEAVILQPQPPKFCDVAIPNEEFKVAPDARDLETAVYIAHVPPMTLSGLREMGFEADDLDVVQHGPATDGALVNARDEDRDTTASRTGANLRVNYREEHVLYDLNEDGIAERLVVHRVGNHILSIEEEEEHPFEEWCPYPMQHRRVGQSLADKVMDIQRTNSVLLRHGMDSLYHSLAPRTLLPETAIGKNTIDDLLAIRPGAIIRYTGNVPPQPLAQPTSAGEAFQAIEFMIAQRESRTGITRLNQGLDADTLNKTATGQAQLQAQGQQMEEYIARNFVNFLARLFAKKARLIKRVGEPIRVQIDGQFRDVDPKQWPDDMIARPKVGLGSGRKEQRLLYRMQLAQMQERAILGGMRIVGEEQIYNSIKGIAADMGLNPNEYVADPAQLPPQEPKPNPEMAKVQAQIQNEQMKLKMKQQELGAKMQLQQAEMQAKLQMMQAQGVQKAQLDAQKAQNDAQMAMLRAQAEAEIAQQRLQIDAMLEQEKLRMEQARAANDERRRDGESSARMDKMRKGGSLAK